MIVMAVAVEMVVMRTVRAMPIRSRVGVQLGVAGTARRSSGFFVRTKLALLTGLLNILGDALAGDALAAFAHVSSQRSLFLLLAERAGLLGGFTLGLSLYGHR